MYLLIAYAGSWLVLLGSFWAAWAQLPPPRTTSDLVVIAIIGAAALAFARHGFVSLLAILLRGLPAGRFRTKLAALVIRIMPRLLASSVLAIVSASLAVQAAHALPTSAHAGDTLAESAHASVAASGPTDPGWPTIEDGQLRNPAWPTEPPNERADPTRPIPDDHRSPEPEPGSGQDDGTGPKSDTGQGPDTERGAGTGPAAKSGPDSAAPKTHVVEAGESLWSIAAELVESDRDTPRLVEDIYSANREVIGPDPSLILAGQRLETQP